MLLFGKYSGRVVGAENGGACLFNKFGLLEDGGEFLQAKLSGNRAGGNNYAVVITRHDHRLVSQVHSKLLLTGAIEGRSINESKHHARSLANSAGSRKRRTERITTPSTTKSSNSVTETAGYWGFPDKSRPLLR